MEPVVISGNAAIATGAIATAPKPIAMKFEGVSYAYGQVAVLDNATFHIHEGEFAVLLGPNGAGKTTILRLLLGLARPDSGRVLVLGANPRFARDSVGYVPQHTTYDPAFPITVEEVVRMGRLRGAVGRFRREHQEAIDQALELAGVSDLRARLYSALSGGQRRRVLVARALAGKPRFLVLDEPTANMDADSERGLYRALGDIKGTATILVVTHDTGYVSALTDTVLCVGEHRGRGRNVTRHAAAPTAEAPEGFFGGQALRVLHDTTVPDSACCGEKADGV
ncbi:MAG: ABC transporter ATP-binding protein [Spirochaetales bacterium]|nr:MAG: ABC transporter ATP-binding protein [Spirochaetales bacterium]